MAEPTKCKLAECEYNDNFLCTADDCCSDKAVKADSSCCESFKLKKC